MIANYCEVLSTKKFVYIKAYDAYSTNLSIIEGMKSDVLLVFSSKDDYLKLYACKDTKWIDELRVLGKAWLLKYS